MDITKEKNGTSWLKVMGFIIFFIVFFVLMNDAQQRSQENHVITETIRENFCPNNISQGLGKYYCPIKDEVQEFLCSGSFESYRCYWLALKPQSDDRVDMK